MSRELCIGGVDIKCRYVTTEKDGTKSCLLYRCCETSNEWLDKHDFDLLDKVAYELKETFNNECPIRYTSTQPFFTLENVRTLIDMVIKEIKAEEIG